MNKWFNPTFWDHPTPINLLIVILGTFLFSYVIAWGLWVITRLPHPPF